MSLVHVSDLFYCLGVVCLGKETLRIVNVFYRHVHSFVLFPHEDFICVFQIVIVAENLSPSSAGHYECRYTCAGFTRSTVVIQVDELSSDAGSTALKCETPLSQQLPPFASQRGQLVSRALFFYLI